MTTRIPENSIWSPLLATARPAPEAHAQAISADPVAFAEQHLGYIPDPIQAEILRSNSRRLMLCMGRRCGKTFTISTRALHYALTNAFTDTLIFSKSQRQANIVLGNVHRFLSKLGIRRKGDGLNPNSIRLPNGSRIVSLPPEPDNIVGFTPNLLILDEAARIPDSLYYAVSPMLAINDPTLILLSTPNGRRGFFYKEWTSADAWQRFFSPASHCPRIAIEWIEEQRRKHPEAYFRQELECEFLDSGGSFFPVSLLERAIDPSLDPFLSPYKMLNVFPRETKLRDFILGLDLGQSLDYSTLTLIERLRLSSLQRDPFTMNFPESWQHRVRHMERMPLNMPYHDVVEHVTAFIQRLTGATGVRSIELVIDATSVGTPIVEMFRRARPQCNLTPVLITAGDFPGSTKDTLKVPKRDLMNRLHLMFEENLIRIPGSLPALEHFREEFQSFRMKQTESGHDTYSADSGTHDDLILSLALAAYRSYR